MLMLFLAREFILAARRSHQFFILFCFYALCSFIFLAVDSSLAGWIFLVTICPLLALLLSFPYIFQQDDRDGMLKDIASKNALCPPIIIAKIIILWTIIGLPQILWLWILNFLITSPLAFLLTFNVMLGNALNLSFLIVLIAALCLRAKAQGGLVFLLILPLYSPSLFYLIRALSEKQSNTWQGLLALTTINAIISLYFTPKILKEALRNDS